MNEDFVKLDSKDLRLLQLNELAILVELDRICRKNNIHYTLAGGTLLGAVRHKGFIPWDDDMDVRFTRTEYEKFFEACKKDMDSEHFFFQDYRTDENYRWGYGKMRLRGTEYVRLGQEHMKFQTGVSIDVFVTDNIPDSDFGKKWCFFKSFIYRKILYSELGMVREKSVLARKWYGFLYKTVSRDFCFKQLEKMARKYNKNKTKYGRTYTWVESWETWRDALDNTFFDEYTELEFEGMKFCAVKEYDRYLTGSYGDYMKLPPIEKRLPSGPASKIEVLDIKLEELQKKYYESLKEIYGERNNRIVSR